MLSGSDEELVKLVPETVTLVSGRQDISELLKSAVDFHGKWTTLCSKSETFYLVTTPNVKTRV